MPDHSYRELATIPADASSAEGDQLVLDELAAAGSNMSVETRFIHFLLFDEEADLVAAGERLARHFKWPSTGDAPSSDEERFVLRAEHSEVLTAESVARMRAFMETIADEYHGAYDDWEAAVQS